MTLSLHLNHYFSHFPWSKSMRISWYLTHMISEREKTKTWWIISAVPESESSSDRDSTINTSRRHQEDPLSLRLRATLIQDPEANFSAQWPPSVCHQWTLGLCFDVELKPLSSVFVWDYEQICVHYWVSTCHNFIEDLYLFYSRCSVAGKVHVVIVNRCTHTQAGRVMKVVL